VAGPVADVENVDPQILADRIKFSAFIQGAPNSIKHDLLQLNNKNKVNINQYNVFDNLDLPESLMRKLNRNTKSFDRGDYAANESLENWSEKLLKFMRHREAGKIFSVIKKLDTVAQEKIKQNMMSSSHWEGMN
jgi:maltooligosyltrehalose synthase